MFLAHPTLSDMLICLLQIPMTEIYRAVPEHLFRKSTSTAMLYVCRDIALAIVLYLAAARLDGGARQHLPTGLCLAARCVTWLTYWIFQGLTFAGFWCLSKYRSVTRLSMILNVLYTGHEAGHGTLSSHRWVNHAIGYTLHTVNLSNLCSSR